MNINLALIGSGCLATAIATGLCSSPEFQGKIYFSVHKNRVNAELLVDKYPEKVFITRTAQDAVDKSDIIIPAVLPNVLGNVASTIKFAARHTIVHVAAGMNLADVQECYKGAGHVLRAVPLPFTAERIGPVVLFGHDENCEALLSLLGEVISAPSEKDLEILAAVTGVMVPYYAVVNEMVKWTQSKGMEYVTARDYVCSMNSALSRLLIIGNVKDIEAHMKENATPGGMNEQALNILNKCNAFRPWQSALEAVGKRYGL